MRAEPVGPEGFRSAVGSFVSGVTVITTFRDGAPLGTTASALTSLCLEPPMVLVCMNRESATRQAVIDCGHFAVNVLREEHAEIARSFARSGDDKFDSVAHTILDGLPLLDEALAHFTCQVERAVDAGTHTVFFALVSKAAADEGPPLVYFRGDLGALGLGHK